ncbi:RNA polymerase sigma factor [Marinoscillum sp. MHG1-6]|uniref:RNA polymerase sigma factor n=1 Tax=Marinoscillum sp. MHG1-6 TaxID=2959627 RepID=UPI002157DC20|nr:RNA polymerase sigma factor [Marinoscillum sp. MHG1-6]
MAISEEELIEGCCKENSKAQQKLYDAYSSSMYPVALRYSKMQQEAEDILQEAFIKVFKNIKTFRKDSSLGYWIKRIVINTALNYQRSKLYLYPMVDVTDLRKHSGTEVTLSSFGYKELMVMIQKLPTGCQIIFNLYAIEGYKHHEIADMLEISEGTSKSQYARAKSLLQKWILENNPEEYERAGGN